METFVDLYVRKHVDRVVRALAKEVTTTPVSTTTKINLVVQPNDDDMKALVVIWDKAYWLALQGTARPPAMSLKDYEASFIKASGLVSNARKIADATVKLFWGGLAQLKD